MRNFPMRENPNRNKNREKDASKVEEKKQQHEINKTRLREICLPVHSYVYSNRFEWDLIRWKFSQHALETLSEMTYTYMSE